MYILIPSYCPDEKLVKLVNELMANNLNVLVVDDGSGEDYKAIFDQLKCEVISYYPNKGKGYALKTGIKHLYDSDIIVTADSDGQHKVEDIIKVAEACKESKELVLGVRNLNQDNVPFKSKHGNRITSFFFFLRCGQHCKDTQTGLRAIPKSLYDMALNSEGERYEYEMNFLCELALKYPFQQVEIETIYENNNEGSHFRPVVDSYRIYKPLLKFIASSLIASFVDIIMFIIFKRYVDVFYAVILARIISASINFIINRHRVFKSTASLKKTAPKYICFVLVLMMLSASFTNLLSKILPATLAKIIVDACLFILSYSVQNRFVYR